MQNTSKTIKMIYLPIPLAKQLERRARAKSISFSRLVGNVLMREFSGQKDSEQKEHEKAKETEGS